jgi:hypothetical protein
VRLVTRVILGALTHAETGLSRAARPDGPGRYPSEFRRSALGGVAVFEHPDDRGFEVVLADPARHRPEMLKRQRMNFQERLLRLVANAA